MKFVDVFQAVLNNSKTIAITTMDNVMYDEEEEYKKFSWDEFVDAITLSRLRSKTKDHSTKLIDAAFKIIKTLGYDPRDIEVLVPDSDIPLLLCFDNSVVAVAPFGSKVPLGEMT